ncbi:hypothetical protein PVK06_024233 [Gossypium arboreum]|uniref:Uncharacterized protein n=1 Tax=Gossypium arboreum TaxID=29729 RepID=A0ABR0PDG6_GOSAR|nr:hypothetical protein PVK06_024233 [Gossypium arboreum]
MGFKPKPLKGFRRNDFSPFCSLGIEALPYCSFNLVHESTRPPSFSLRIPGPLLPDLSWDILLHFLITVRESSSIIASVTPNSNPVLTVYEHARASATNAEPTFEWSIERDAITCPCAFLATIPVPDLKKILIKGCVKIKFDAYSQRGLPFCIDHLPDNPLFLDAFYFFHVSLNEP